MAQTMNASSARASLAQIRTAVDEFVSATAERADADLFTPMTFLLAQVRESLGMDVVFVSRFLDQQRVFEVVSASGEATQAIVPGGSDPLLDTYCLRIVEGRLPLVIPDTRKDPEAAGLAVTQRLRIGAYLSAPVILRNGQLFGTVCCISHSPREDLRESDAQQLAAVAQAVAASVERTGRIRYASWSA